MSIKQIKCWWHCACCGAVVDHFRYKYDSTPSGDDESVCPECGVDSGFCEVLEDKWKIKKATNESAGRVYEIQCTKCGHCETVSRWPWPDKCYVCEEVKT